MKMASWSSRSRNTFPKMSSYPPYPSKAMLPREGNLLRILRGNEFPIQTGSLYLETCVLNNQQWLSSYVCSERLFLNTDVTIATCERSHSEQHSVCVHRIDIKAAIKTIFLYKRGLPYRLRGKAFCEEPLLTTKFTWLVAYFLS